MSEFSVQKERHEPVLRVENLVKHFPLKHSKSLVRAVNGVSFHVMRGETLALIGESGSGKTTVGRCILRLLDPTDGRIFFSDTEITGLSRRRMQQLRPRMQLVFQEPYESLNPRMTAFSILSEPLQLAGIPNRERQERIHELFNLVQLDRRALHSYPHQFSGGEQQRLGIARAIATNPDIVVLDEPTSALDISVRAEILDLLARLQPELGISYLFISHDLTAVRAISDRVAVMYLGRIVEEAETRDLFQEQAHPYTQGLLSSVLIPTPEVPLPPVQLSGEIPSPIDLPSGCHLHPRCPFKIDQCASELPPLEQFNAPGRSAACWRAEEVLRESVPVPVYTPPMERKKDHEEGRRVV